MDVIMRALRQYEREPGTKKAVLLTQSGGYYLYDGRFCAMSDFDLYVTGEDLHIQGTSVPCGLFFGVADGKLRWSAGERGAFLPEQLSLIFHIALGDTGELLRGILFAQGEQAHLSLFTNADMEELYRMVVSPEQKAPPPVVSEELNQLAEDCARDDLHRLTALYLHSQRLSQLKTGLGGGAS